MVVKLDISKVYDKLEWSFLDKRMRKLGFNDVWIFRVMSCVTTASYAILINGQPDPIIVPSRGIHQRDHLSPYFYLIYAEGLSCLLNKVDANGRIGGVKVAQGSPSITHLFFADDSFIFCSFWVGDKQTQVWYFL